MFRAFCFLLLFSLNHCNTKKDIPLDNMQQNKELQDDYSTKYRMWLLDRDSKQKQDSVLYYLNKLIVLNNKEDFYLVEKIKFLSQNSRYVETENEFTKLNSKDSFSIKLLEALIAIKKSPEEGNKKLRELYDKIQKNNNIAEEEIIYKIGLDNHFKGKDYANEIIENLIKNREGTYEQELLYVLSEKINSEESLDVLFHLFNLPPVDLE